MLGLPLLLVLAAAKPEPALIVRHLPPVEAKAGTELLLRADVTPAYRLAGLWVYSRRGDSGRYEAAAFGRDADGSYAVKLELPPREGVLEYYLSAQELGQPARPVFASAEHPFQVLIHPDTEAEETRRWLGHTGGTRSRVDITADWVDYGRADIAGQRFADHYYRGEVAYRYAILDALGALRIDTIRLGVGTMRANVPPVGGALEAYAAGGKAGLDYGFSEVAVGLSPWVGVTTRLIIGGNREGFAAGAGGMLRLGKAFGSRVELAAESTSGIGTSGTFRLCWVTVPRVPMSAAVQLTNVPTGVTGVRFVYSADFELFPSLTLGARIGYQARRSLGGGLSFGFGASYGW